MRITSHVHALKLPFRIPLAPGRNLDRFVYSYLVCGSERTCLVDSGVAGSNAAIAGLLAGLGLDFPDISLLVLTHAHPDHIGGAQNIRNRSGCRVAAHAEARSWVEDTEKQFAARPVPGFHSLVEGPVPVDFLLADGDIIKLGDTSLQILTTPGHSRCSISLFCPEEGVLFSGDAIPQENDLPIYEDAALAVQSIRRLRELHGVKHLLSSWSDPEPDADPYRCMDNGLRYFQTMHTSIRQLAGGKPASDPMDLCRRMVEKLGLPEVAVNPLTARSFASHLGMIEREML